MLTKSAIILTALFAGTFGQFLFGGGSGSQSLFGQRNSLLDRLGFRNSVFDGSALQAATSNNAARATDLEVANENVDRTALNVANNQQVHFINQNRLSFANENGQRSALDFGNRVAQSNDAAIQTQDVQQDQTLLERDRASDFLTQRENANAGGLLFG